MNNKRATKRALLTSVMALVMCVVMLVGTTFAWFTDTASTGVNKIVAGNLKVDIVNEAGTASIKNSGLEFVSADNVTKGEAILWEPGCRYLTEGFRIKNDGNLALKWKAEINKDNIVDGKVEGSTIAKDGKSLLDVIDFYVVTKATDGTETAVAIENFTGKLGATETSGVYYIKGVMKTTAGNDYQDLTLDGITITVYATQDTVENDSFNNQYDKDAQYPDVDVVTVTPDTIPSPFRANTAYFFEAGNYGDQHFVITDKENVTLIGKTGAKFDSLRISSIDYVNPSIRQEVDLDNSTLTVKGFEVTNVLEISVCDKNVVVEDNAAGGIKIKTTPVNTTNGSGSCDNIAVNNNKVTGGQKYGIDIVPNITDYDLTITGNSFTSVKSHAIHVQGCGDGSAVTAAKSINVTGNTFNSYGNGKAAFKIWCDTKYAPTENAEANDAAKALAKTVKESNTFDPSLGSDYVVANFYGTDLKLSDFTTNP